MKVSVDDLETLVKWLRKNSGDVNVNIDISYSGEVDVMHVQATDGARQLANIVLYDADSSRVPSVTVNQPLKQGLKP